MTRFSSLLLYFCIFLSLLVGSRVFGSLLEKTSALFIFGDSSVDSGNNNHINTILENQADYKPYGQNGFFEGPTGRFSDGRLFVDFIAEYAKLPLIPPFLQPSADYAKGVNFASAGAGILSQTNRGNEGLVINLQTQLKYSEKVEKSLTERLGEAKMKELISEAVYFISMGSNDYMGGYIGDPKMQASYSPEEYVGMVIGNLTQALQVLYDRGARKFGFLSLSPLGCLPGLRAVNPKPSEDGCLEAASALAQAHNSALKVVLTRLEHMLKGFKYCNPNFYDWLYDRMVNPSKYGFRDGMNACCGTGPHGSIYNCGGKNNILEFKLCENANDHVWWDSFHPTERLHEQLAKALWNGRPWSTLGRYSLEDFFFNPEKLAIADIVDVPKGEHFQ